MKIEKLTENKIRIILKPEDIKDKSLDLHTIMTKTAESQGFLLEILSKAKREIGFDTDGCRILVEAYSSPEDFFVFTVTKYSIEQEENKNMNLPRKSIKVKRKVYPTNPENFICQFENFETFCDFCDLLHSFKNLSIRGLIGGSSLYVLNDLYYLVLKDFNVKHKANSSFHSYITEFGKLINYTNTFENKLKEYGKIVIKKNAISTGIKYFCK